MRGKGEVNEHILPRQLRRHVQVAREGCCEERMTKDPNNVKKRHSRRESGELGNEEEAHQGIRRSRHRDRIVIM